MELRYPAISFSTSGTNQIAGKSDIQSSIC